MSEFAGSDQKTMETYNRAAEAYAKKFAGIGPRTDDLERAFASWGGENPRVLELGCGDGRDAEQICELTTQYIGIDNSIGMIEIAKKRLLKGEFTVADLVEYSPASQIDIIFAFASLLHVDREAFNKVLQKAREFLFNDGIFFISLKHGTYEGGKVVVDANGERTFFYYEEKDVRSMAKGYKVIYVSKTMRGSTDWLDIMLKKI